MEETKSGENFYTSLRAVEYISADAVWKEMVMMAQIHSAKHNSYIYIFSK